MGVDGFDVWPGMGVDLWEVNVSEVPPTLEG
jgi:hypothetical protein